MSRWVAGLALLLASCTCGPADPQCTAFPMSTNQLFVVGRPATFELSMEEGCRSQVPTDFHKATSVSVALLDPSGAPAPNVEVSPLEYMSSGGTFHRNVVKVRFTPHVRGTWLVKARFDPELGNLQLFVPAADDLPVTRARSVPLPEFAFGFCTEVGVTASGTVLCGERMVNGPPVGLVTHLGQRLDDPAYALEGDAVWALGGSPPTVRRYVDDGGTLVLSHTGKVPSVGMSPRLGAAAGDLWVATGGRAYRLHPEPDGGLTLVSNRSLPTGFVVTGIAARADRVMLLGQVNSQGRLVTLAADDGGAALPLTSVPGVVGAEPDAIWSMGLNGFQVSIDDGFPVVDAPRVGPVNAFEAPVLWPYVPALSTNFPEPSVVFARRDAGEVWLETFHADGYQPPFAASPTHAFARSRDRQSLLVIER